MSPQCHVLHCYWQYMTLCARAVCVHHIIVSPQGIWVGGASRGDGNGHQEAGKEKFGKR